MNEHDPIRVPDCDELKHGGWRKPVAPPTAVSRPAGLPPKPTPPARPADENDG